MKAPLRVAKRASWELPLDFLQGHPEIAGRHPCYGMSDIGNCHGLPERILVIPPIDRVRERYAVSLLVPPPWGVLAPSGDPIIPSRSGNRPAPRSVHDARRDHLQMVAVQVT